MGSDIIVNREWSEHCGGLSQLNVLILMNEGHLSTAFTAEVAICDQI